MTPVPGYRSLDGGHECLHRTSAAVVDDRDGGNDDLLADGADQRRTRRAVSKIVAPRLGDATVNYGNSDSLQRHRERCLGYWLIRLTVRDVTSRLSLFLCCPVASTLWNLNRTAKPTSEQRSVTRFRRR